MALSRHLTLWGIGTALGLLAVAWLLSDDLSVPNAQASSAYDDSAELIGYRPRTLYVLNNDPANYTLQSVGKPGSGTAQVVDNAVVYTAAEGFEGEDIFSYRAEGPQGDVVEPTVRLRIVPNSLAAAIDNRLAAEPAFAATFVENLLDKIESDPEGPDARALSDAIKRRMENDPWFAKRFKTLYRAALTRRPIDLYVFIGDDNLQGTTQSGNFKGPDTAFAEELDRLWDEAPDENNASAILVLNCAVAGTVLPQWSGLNAPRGSLPDWLDNSHGAALSSQCMRDIDAMLRNPDIPAVLRGIVIDTGANDARLAAANPGLVSSWGRALRRTIDLYRASYGSDFGVILSRLPAAGADLPYANAWQDIRRAQDDYRYYNTALVDTDGLDLWNRSGEMPLFSDSGQQQYARRLAAAAYALWHRVFYNLQDEQPVLGAVGECSRLTPCFPHTPYHIEPQLCEDPQFFRQSREQKQVLCDQHGHSLHALASGCNHCVNLEHIAGQLGVGLVKVKTGQHFGSTYYMPQLIGGRMIEPLPYQNPYTVGEPRPCGYQDRESSTFVLEPGSHDYVVQARQVEYCTESDSAGCGLLLSPDTVVTDQWTKALDIASGQCREVLVQHPGGEQISCGHEITRDTVLGHDLHCGFDQDIALIVRGSDITLDLNGYTLSGTSDTSDDTLGLLIHESNNVTVRNGVIEGFAFAITIVNNSSGVDINRLTLRQLSAEAEGHHVRGIHMFNKVRDVTIRDVLFEFISKFHADGIGLDDSLNVVARNTEQIGGASLLAVGPYECEHEESPITFELHNSIARGTYLSPVFAQCTTSARVIGNRFEPGWNHAAGITAHAGKPGYVKALEVTNNFFHGGMIGIDFAGIDDSEVRDNYITDSYLYGIAMNYSLLCAHQESPGSHPLPDWFDCFGASGNLIENNWVTSKSKSAALKPKSTDLYQHPLSHDNTWADNICESTDGEAIPPCLPVP